MDPPRICKEPGLGTATPTPPPAAPDPPLPTTERCLPAGHPRHPSSGRSQSSRWKRAGISKGSVRRPALVRSERTVAASPTPRGVAPARAPTPTPHWPWRSERGRPGKAPLWGGGGATQPAAVGHWASHSASGASACGAGRPSPRPTCALLRSPRPRGAPGQQTRSYPGPSCPLCPSFLPGGPPRQF